MRNDEREQVRPNTDWARRMRALERDFQRADQARRAGPARQSVPVAILSGALVLVTAILIVALGTRGSTTRTRPPVPSGPFVGTPPYAWPDAGQALTMPRAGPLGPYAAADIAPILDAARTYLLTARTNSAVLAGDRSPLRELADPRASTSSARGIAKQLPATVLAPRNTLTAPVRLLGSVTDRYMPATRRDPAHVVVDANLVWAYALRAEYPLAQIPDYIVALHERVQLLFYAPVNGHAKPVPGSDALLWYDVDCGYLAQSLLGLPRADDPNALPGYNNGVSQDQAFDLSATITVSSHVCRR